MYDFALKLRIFLGREVGSVVRALVFFVAIGLEGGEGGYWCWLASGWSFNRVEFWVRTVISFLAGDNGCFCSG